MKSHAKYIPLNTNTRYGISNITPRVIVVVQKSGIKEDLCLVNLIWITSGVFINNNERGLYQAFLERQEPAHYNINKYKHNLTGAVSYSR